MAQLAAKARTVFLLGPVNVANVALYRLSLLVGLSRGRRLRAQLPSGPYFRPASVVRTETPSAAWREHGTYFGWLDVPWRDKTCPDWHANPVAGTRVPDPARPWWRIPDHDPRVGDIKTVREASRFDWALAMAQRAAAGESSECDRLNAWLDDWCRENPAYRGPNWVCGMEASIRVLHLAMAALVSGQTEDPCPNLLGLVDAHLQRIVPTMRYAMAQDNNHGASEAAALFVGGSWLAKLGQRRGTEWEHLGRRWLEKWTLRLIAPDGSSGQYSVNYHRFVVDILSMAEVWRRHAGLAPFSARWRERAASAARWLAAMVDPETGDAFNVGANDGSRLLPLTDTDYRDYRPSVQLAMALFTSTRVYPATGRWNEPLHWLGVPVPNTTETLGSSRLFDDSGFILLRRGAASVLLRYPRFRFRPSQADALHLDLWVSGRNLLRDAGTFSYNHHSLGYFSGTEGHNTVQFDDRDQMPHLGRFLFGDWLRTRELQAPRQTTDGERCGASYQDRQGASHRRAVSLENHRLIVEDDVQGFVDKAVLRWRLAPGSWRTDGTSVTNGEHVLSLKATMPVVRFALVEGWESRYYLQKTPTPVLEIEVHESGTLTTEYQWQRS